MAMSERSRRTKVLTTMLQILHGTDDQVVPIDATGRRSAEICKNATIKEFPGPPHALPTICTDEVNQALLEFLQS